MYVFGVACLSLLQEHKQSHTCSVQYVHIVSPLLLSPLAVRVALASTVLIRLFAAVVNAIVYRKVLAFYICIHFEHFLIQSKVVIKNWSAASQPNTLSICSCCSLMPAFECIGIIVQHCTLQFFKFKTFKLRKNGHQKMCKTWRTEKIHTRTHVHKTRFRSRKKASLNRDTIRLNRTYV